LPPIENLQPRHSARMTVSIQSPAANQANKSSHNLGGGVPTSPRESVGRASHFGGAPMSPTANPMRSKSKGVLGTAFVRPDDAGATLADMTSKRNTHLAASEYGSFDLTTPGRHSRYDSDIIDLKVRRLQTPSGESSITAKEDILEQIMSMEAHAGFEQMGRHQLNKSIVTRVAVNPAALSSRVLDSLPDPTDLGDEDLQDEVCELDDELISRCGLEQYQTKDMPNLPQALAEAPGVRLGFGIADEECEQDRLFAARCDKYLLVGIVNSHGRHSTGVKLARLVATEMPKAVFRSAALAREGGDPARALSDAFSRMHRKAARFLDVRLTGAAVTLALIDPDCIWIAHVGDCRAVLAVPDHRPNAEDFHFNPVALTQDHRLSVKGEFDRIQSCGGEMRKLVNDSVYRLFLRDGDVPGLVLTRAIGDRIGHAVGVCHFPSVSAIRREDVAEGSFLILGSGGLWATVSERQAVSWVSRSYGDPGEAAESLSSEAFHRWQDKQHPATRSLSKSIDDCFSVAVVFLDPAHQASRALPQRPRPFVTGHHMRHAEKKDWSEVKSLDRTTSLRRTQANGRPLTEDHALRPSTL